MADDSEHQPVVVKATYADGTVSYYDSARHAHATHFDGSPVLSIEPAPGEAERVEGPATKLTAPADFFDGSPVLSIEPAPGEAERVEGPATKLTAPADFVPSG